MQQPLRRLRDTELREAIERVSKENSGIYGARKVWLQLRRKGVIVARCMLERLMRAMGLRGVVRREKTCATIPVAFTERPWDPV